MPTVIPSSEIKFHEKELNTEDLVQELLIKEKQRIEKKYGIE